MSPYLPPILAFLAGSIPFGLFIARTRGIDLRKEGSGNIGATNAIRVLGKPLGFTVFALDFLKGFLPVWWAVSVFPSSATDPTATWIHVLTAMAAILGHNYPPWLGFKGGKGISTSAGALLALIPFALLIAVAVWAALLRTTRYVSVASMGAAVSLPIVTAVQGLAEDGIDPAKTGLCLLICVLAIWRHRSNIRRLASGTEPKIRVSGRSSREAAAPPAPDPPTKS